MPKVFISPIDVLVFKRRAKFGRREIVQNMLPASQTVTTAWIAPKIRQGQHPTMYSECSRFYPNRFTFGGVIAERVNTTQSYHKVNIIFHRSLASSRKNIPPKLTQ